MMDQPEGFFFRVILGALVVVIVGLVSRLIRKPRGSIAPDVPDPESEHKETMEYFTMKNAADRAKGER
jgi:hypothetical protein